MMFLIVFFMTTWITPAPLSVSSTIVLNPGVEIDELFSKETYECALTLKHELQKRFPSLHIILSRGMYEKTDQKQIASACNHLSPDLFISLHICKNFQPTVSVYSYLQNPTTDYWNTQKNPLTLIPTDKAHLAYTKISRSLTEQLIDQLKKQYPNASWYGIPFKPLRGIHAPAFALELSVARSNEWRSYVASLTKSLSSLIEPESLLT